MVINSIFRKTASRIKVEDITNDRKYFICTLYAIILLLFGFVMDSPKEIFSGLYKIMIAPDALITDYIGVGGLGATFVNAGAITLISIYILYRLKVDISGASLSTLWLMSGFALFGKNLLNIWFIIIGVWLYAKFQKEKMIKYILIALLGTSLSPMITQIMFMTAIPPRVSIPLGIFLGLLTGFILPPLSAYLMRVHQGFNLYNIGFTSGIIGMIFVSLFKSYGINMEGRMVWTAGNNRVLMFFLVFIFLSMILWGYLLNNRSFKGFKNIYDYSGRLITDFVVLEGFAVSLLNMGVNGLAATAYVLLVGGELNGPTIGGIFTIVGFSSFGKHLKNMIPIFLGVFIGSATKIWHLNDPAILLAALFGTTLAPIAGEFGWGYGMLAGFIHSSVVLNVGVMHGGLNLYNNGFAGGFVAATFIPIIEAIRKEK